MDELRIELEKKNTEYAVKGGDIVEQRHDLMAQRSEAVATVESHQSILLEMAAGAIPMILVRTLLEDIQIQGEMEQSYRTSRLATQKVNSLYKDFLKKYPDSGSEIQKFVEYVRAESESQQGEEIYQMSDTTLYQVTSLINGGLLSELGKIFLICNEETLVKVK